ncbi:MAG: anaerobic ribonucleoside-triphosphate reductase activating protein [Candidatus Altiarchaeales archaeon]|nr:MAG: anaerobic ribonucleoside-triphosphate reductase activating protein [Candidatus Altiarchaeales archaeon]
MEIGGLQKLSLIDYPGRLSCIIFTIGCNFRCSYCYNPSLVEGTCGRIPQKEIFSFLRKRKGLLDGVIITGGEPTIHNDLPDFIQRIKKMGFLVGLETNGTNPRMIKKLISKRLIDYIAMDVKAPLKKYKEIVNVEVDLDKIKESIDVIMNSGIEYEFRTTCYPLLTKDDFIKIFKLIKGAKKYGIQQFLDKNTLMDTDLKPYPDKFLYELKKISEDYVEGVEVRASGGISG